MLVPQFHICRLQTSCFSLLLNSPSDQFRNGVPVRDIWHCGAMAGLTSLSCTAILCFLEGCRIQPVLAWFCLSLRNGQSLGAFWWFVGSCGCPWSSVPFESLFLAVDRWSHIWRSAVGFTTQRGRREWELEAEVARVLFAGAMIPY